MSPGAWVASVLGFVVVCWLVAFIDQMANGTKEERKAFEAKRAQADAEALLQAADQESTERPRVRAMSEPITYKGFPHGH